MGSKHTTRDALDDKLDVWAREIPDLDRTTEGIMERIQVLAWNLNQSREDTLAKTGLDRRTARPIERRPGSSRRT